MYSHRKVGGIHFVAIGQLVVSFCLSRRRPPVLTAPDLPELLVIWGMTSVLGWHFNLDPILYLIGTLLG